ncbi:hypothetical protein HZA97_04440 [Candidatus Woesearchaeota archaeon]|nr:hypothetical protein [Candidatus Woesearchaeota archaeon]
MEGNKMEEQKIIEPKTNLEKTLENEIRFSWGAVLKGWIQNLKDDVDPAITGVKMGFFGLHAIPTWMRQYDEGRMSTKKNGLTGLLGLVVAGSSLTGYYLAGKYINETTNSELGYAVTAIPLTAQTLSWSYEAFLRAKKTELSKVVMSRLQKSFNKESETQYDLTSKALVEEFAKRLYDSFEEQVKKTNEEIKLEIQILNDKGMEGLNAIKRAEIELLPKGRRQQLINNNEEQIKSNNASLERYKSKSVVYARREMLRATNSVFNGLVADGSLGRKYNMTTDLLTGPVKRRMDREKFEFGQFESDENDLDDREFKFDYRQAGLMLRQIVLETVKSKQGNPMSLETFGTITPVYTNAGKDLVYQVKPNNIWKV